MTKQLKLSHLTFFFITGNRENDAAIDICYSVIAIGITSVNSGSNTLKCQPIKMCAQQPFHIMYYLR